MPAETYLATAIREFKRYQELADRAMAQLPADQFFTQPGPGDNSVAIIVKHVSGNIRSRWLNFLTTDGEKPDRHRDNEFLILPGDTREQLLARWAEAWAILFRELAPLIDADLARTVMIRGEPLTVLQAITRQIAHYAHHVGQIVYLAKHLVGPGWKSLSIPVGQSEKFNQAPTNYLR